MLISTCGEFQLEVQRNRENDGLFRAWVTTVSGKVLSFETGPTRDKAARAALAAAEKLGPAFQLAAAGLSGNVAWSELTN